MFTLRKNKTCFPSLREFHSIYNNTPHIYEYVHFCENESFVWRHSWCAKRQLFFFSFKLYATWESFLTLAEVSSRRISTNSIRVTHRLIFALVHISRHSSFFHFQQEIFWRTEYYHKYNSNGLESNRFRNPSSRLWVKTWLKLMCFFSSYVIHFSASRFW